MGKYTNLSKTLYKFFSQFGNAYVENSVPSGATFPYITYTVAYDEEYEDTLLQARIWTKGTSFTEVAALADKIGEAIGTGVKFEGVEGGIMWLHQGSPFQQNISNEDETIKSVYINIVQKYLI